MSTLVLFGLIWLGSIVILLAGWMLLRSSWRKGRLMIVVDPHGEGEAGDSQEGAQRSA